MQSENEEKVLAMNEKVLIAHENYKKYVCEYTHL